MNRRDLLRSLCLAPLAAAAPNITVTGLEIFSVRVNARGNWQLARVRTSAGLTGIGDASHSKDEVTATFLRRFFDLLKGRGIFDAEWLRRAAEPEIFKAGQPAAVALSALEQCLWDIRGKAFSVPTYQLFGGQIHPAIRNYANINRSTNDRSPAGFASMAERAVAAGFDAVKLAPFDDMPRDLSNGPQIEEFTKLGIERAAAVRRAIGPDRDLLIDVHSHLDLPRGLELARRLEPLNLFWLEEVTPAKPVTDLAAINAVATMPTAGGETLYGVKEFYPYIAGKAVDIVMPDVKYCGGMMQLKEIAALAEAAQLKVSPHGPASPVGNMAAAQVCSGLPNFLILEHSYGEVPWRAELIDPPEALEKGRMTLSQRPGFGIELNEKTAARYAAR